MSRTQRHLPAWLFVLTLGLLLLRIGLAAGVVTLPAEEPLVTWLDVSEAKDEAARTGRPLLVDFAADWCAPCRQMERETFGDEDVAARLRREFVLARVFVEGSPTEAQASVHREWRVSSYPALVAVLPSGTQVRAGFMTAPEMHRFLDRVELRRLTEENARRRALSARTPPASPSR